MNNCHKACLSSVYPPRITEVTTKIDLRAYVFQRRLFIFNSTKKKTLKTQKFMTWEN